MRLFTFVRSDLPFRLKRSAKREFGALSLLRVESTVCFQRKRRRERAVTRERHELSLRLYHAMFDELLKNPELEF